MMGMCFNCSYTMTSLSSLWSANPVYVLGYFNSSLLLIIGGQTKALRHTSLNGGKQRVDIITSQSKCIPNFCRIMRKFHLIFTTNNLL